MILLPEDLVRRQVARVRPRRAAVFADGVAHAADAEHTATRRALATRALGLRRVSGLAVSVDPTGDLGADRCTSSRPRRGGLRGRATGKLFGCIQTGKSATQNKARPKSFGQGVAPLLGTAAPADAIFLASSIVRTGSIRRGCARVARDRSPPVPFGSARVVGFCARIRRHRSRVSSTEGEAQSLCLRLAAHGAQVGRTRRWRGPYESPSWLRRGETSYPGCFWTFDSRIGWTAGRLVATGIQSQDCGEREEKAGGWKAHRFDTKPDVWGSEQIKVEGNGLRDGPKVLVSCEQHVAMCARCHSDREIRDMGLNALSSETKSGLGHPVP